MTTPSRLLAAWLLAFTMVAPALAQAATARAVAHRAAPGPVRAHASPPAHPHAHRARRDSGHTSHAAQREATRVAHASQRMHP